MAGCYACGNERSGSIKWGIPSLAEELLTSQQGLCTIELVRILCLHSGLHKTDEFGVAVKSLLTFNWLVLLYISSVLSLHSFFGVCCILGFHSGCCTLGVKNFTPFPKLSVVT